MGLDMKVMVKKYHVGYSECNYNIESDDERSTESHLFYYGSTPISRYSHKQDIVALSDRF